MAQVLHAGSLSDQMGTGADIRNRHIGSAVWDRDHCFLSFVRLQAGSIVGHGRLADGAGSAVNFLRPAFCGIQDVERRCRDLVLGSGVVRFRFSVRHS